MPYFDVANLVTVTDEYDRWNSLWLWNYMYNCWENMAPSLPQSRAEVSASLEVSHRLALRSQLLQNLTILQVNSYIILNAPPWLQVLSGAPENALVESESTLLSSRGAWEHLKVVRRTGEVDRSVNEVWVWLPERFTFCGCRDILRGRVSVSSEIYSMAMVVWTQRCTWMPWSSVHRDLLGCQDLGTLQIHLEAAIAWF